MKILLVGGGSGGPVAPLLAVAEEIKIEHPLAEFLLVGTKKGPERLMAEQAKIAFVSISAGKWRRYFSLVNLFAPFQVVAGFWQSFGILSRFRPDCVFGAGSFVQVPLVWAARIKGIPVVLHQQDIIPSLANILCQYAAKKITVTFESSLTDFYSAGLFYKKHEEKIILTGNPCRRDLSGVNKAVALRFFKLRDDMPVLYIVGGGTGAKFINESVQKMLPELARTVQVIHSTGPGKFEDLARKLPNYHPYEFIKEPGMAYAAADMVLSRAGLSTITELSFLKKLAIIVPMPESHQVINAYLLADSQSAVVIPQSKFIPENFVRLVRRLLFEPNLQEILKNNISKIMPKNSNKKIAGIILKLITRYK